jgi:hypothetical protein
MRKMCKLKIEFMYYDKWLAQQTNKEEDIDAV